MAEARTELNIWKAVSRDKRVTEIDYQLKYAIFFHSMFYCVQLYCTRPISKHLYLGIFKDTLDTKHNFIKKDWIHKCYVSCLKLDYFFKSCKTKPLNGYYVQQVAVRLHSKNLS